MPNIYPMEYLNQFEVYDGKPTTDRQEALAKAKELRKQGWTITVKKWNFEGVDHWIVEGRREK